MLFSMLWLCYCFVWVLGAGSGRCYAGCWGMGWDMRHDICYDGCWGMGWDMRHDICYAGCWCVGGGI